MSQLRISRTVSNIRLARTKTSLNIGRTLPTRPRIARSTSPLAIARTVAYNPNPTLMLLEGNGGLSGTDQAGSFSAVSSGALRYALAKDARINLVKNPRFAVDTTGWSNNGAALSRIASDSQFGGACGEIVASAASQGIVTSATGTARLASTAVHTLSFDAYVVSGSSTWQITLEERDAANGSIVVPAATVFVPTSTVQRFTLTYTPTGTGVHLLRINLTTRPIGDGGAAGTLRIANIQLESGASATSYFDGSTGVWLDPIIGALGTAHASPSVNQAAFWVEESTTNLLLNPSAEVNAITGVAAFGSATITRDTAFACNGSSSFKVVTPGGAAFQGMALNSNTSLGLTGAANPYASQCLMRGAGTVNVRIRVTYTDATIVDGTATLVTLTDQWQRVTPVIVTLDSAKTVNVIQLTLRTDVDQATTFYIDSAQVEQKAYASSYCDGSLGTGYSWSGTAHASSSTRTASTVKLDESSRLNPTEGAIALWLYREVARPTVFYSFSAGQNSAGKDLIGIRHTPSIVQLICASNGGGTELFGATAVGIGAWAFVYVEWNGTDVGISVNGAALTTGARTAPQGSITSTFDMAIGHLNSSSGAEIDGRVGPVRIFSRPLASSEISSLYNAGPMWGFNWAQAAGISRQAA